MSGVGGNRRGPTGEDQHMKIKTWWKTLKRSMQLLLVAALFLTIGVVTYAASQTFVMSEEKQGGITSVPFVEVDLNFSGFSGPVTPGDTISGSVALTNNGNGTGMAFIRFNFPTISTAPGMDGSAYTWSVNDGWTEVEKGTGYTVYGYDTPLDGAGETVTSPFDAIVMKGISNEVYKSLGGNVNVSFVGYMADCNEYGTDSATAWSRANQ